MSLLSLLRVSRGKIRFLNQGLADHFVGAIPVFVGTTPGFVTTPPGSVRTTPALWMDWG